MAASRAPTPPVRTPGGTDAGAVLVEDWTRDMLAADLALDLTALTGTAVLTIAPADRASVSFAVGGIDVTAVTVPGGEPLPHRVAGGRLDVELPALPGGDWLSELTVAYGFQQWPSAGLPMAGGWLTGGSTILWPDYCSRLFPCKPDPADGLSYTLALTGRRGLPGRPGDAVRASRGRGGRRAAGGPCP